MNRRKRVALASMGLVLIAMVFAGPVVAKATKETFGGTWTTADIALNPGKIWSPGHKDADDDWWNWPWPDGYRMQARGWWLGTEFQTGDDRVNGQWEMLFDDHYDGQWAGPWNGTFVGKVTCDDGTDGVWEGTFTGKCYGGAGLYGGIAYGQGQGSGCVNGMKIYFDMENIVDGDGVEYRTLEGCILDPHGE
jgi:hypothetical protein